MNKFAAAAISGDSSEMPEKRRVPEALHHELSEYASLLRALRARDALDLTKHLVKPSPFVLDNVEDPPCPGPSDLTHPANSQSPPRSLKARGKQKEVSEPPQQEQIRRDHWTRWPLLLKDVLLPEWTLQDEVAVIAAQAMKSRPPLVFPVPVASPDSHLVGLGDEDDPDRLIQVMDIDVDSDDPDPPFYIPYLTSIIAKYLTVIFSILASHTPARPASMQNRIEPLNWRAVIDVIVSCGIPEFSNAKLVENVIKRMEAIYGPSILPLEDPKAKSLRAVERIKSKQAATQEFEKMMENAKANYFAQAPPPHRSPSPDQIPVKKRKINKVAVKEEAEYKEKRTRKNYDGPPRNRGNPNKKRPPAESPSRHHMSTVSVDADVATEGTSSQPTRRSTRTRNNVDYLEKIPGLPPNF